MTIASTRQAAWTICTAILLIAASGYAAVAAPPTRTGPVTESIPAAMPQFQLVHAQTTSTSVRETEFAVGMANSLAAGTYTFDVQNAGLINHDLVISQSGAEVARTPNIPSSSASTLTVTLSPGTYEFWCSIPGHRSLGMTTTVSVS